jgi:hypothetical protein
MAIIKNIKGRLIDVEALIPGTVRYFHNKLHIELKEKERISMATTTAYFMVKQGFIPEFNPFECSLKKIYGNDFFSDNPKLHDDKVFYGDTDGDAPTITGYPFFVPDVIEMVKIMLGKELYEKVGKETNLATKRLKLTPTLLREAVRKHKM